MITAFMEGVNIMEAFDDADTCFLKKTDGYLIAGERNGSKLENFDLGNSPYDYINAGVKGKNIAVTTTNGTRALYASKDSPKVLIGAFLNLSAIAKEIVREGRNVLLFCAGWKGMPNTEDTLFAGNLIDLLINEGFSISDDSARLSYDFYLQNRNSISGIIRESAHARRLGKLTDIEADLAFSAQVDIAEIVPEFRNGLITQ
jgi:2-phosphosulfolactate phosphatase